MTDAERVRALGEEIGFGNLMHEAEQQWHVLLRRTGLAGGEFVVGPCAALVVPCDHRVRDQNGHCDVCCGCGWITRYVSERLVPVIETVTISPDETKTG